MAMRRCRAHDRRLLFSGKLPRQFPVLDLHALRRDAYFGGGRRRRHGGHAGRGGAAVRALPRRTHRAPSAGGHRLRGAAASLLLALAKDHGGTADIGRHSLGQPAAAAARCSARPATSSSASGSPARCRPRRISALINLWGLALVTPLGLWQALRFDFGAVPAAIVAAAGLLFDRCEHGHRLAVDDRACNTCRRRRPGSSR